MHVCMCHCMHAFSSHVLICIYVCAGHKLSVLCCVCVCCAVWCSVCLCVYVRALICICVLHVDVSYLIILVYMLWGEFVNLRTGY